MKSTVILSTAIIAVALIASVGLYLYFSPYHSCVRALAEAGYERADAALACLQGIEPEEGPEPARPFTSAYADRQQLWGSGASDAGTLHHAEARARRRGA